MIHCWRFSRCGGKVLIPSSLLDAMMNFAGAALPNETGGTLVGHYEEGDSVALVEQVLGVRYGAERDVARFFRPPDDVDGQLAEIFHASEGRTHYLGEWHTHPGSSPTPSRIDCRTMRELARSPSVASDTPLLMILGGQIVAAPIISCSMFSTIWGDEAGVYVGQRKDKVQAQTLTEADTGSLFQREE